MSVEHTHIVCGHPDEMPDNTQYIVSLDKNVKPKSMDRQTRVVRHIPNPFRGKGNPIDMSVVNMSDVWDTASMIVTLGDTLANTEHVRPEGLGVVFFHCRMGRDRTGIVRNEVNRILKRRVMKNEKK